MGLLDRFTDSVSLADYGHWVVGAREGSGFSSLLCLGPERGLRLTRLGGFGHRVRLALPLHRVRVEGVGVAGSEDRSGGYQDAVEAAS